MREAAELAQPYTMVALLLRVIENLSRTDYNTRCAIHGRAPLRSPRATEALKRGTVPDALAELDARIAKLQNRLVVGDEGMTREADGSLWASYANWQALRPGFH